MSRREFAALTAASMTALASGCATNPVSGKRQFMLITQSMEVSYDRKWAPQQFSADYGAVQDYKLNEYLSSIGRNMAVVTDRPSMPYNFRALNAVVVNAYTMPAGSIGLARGLLLEMDNEAQMSSIIGHELAHVNWKHAAERISKSLLLNAVIAGGGAYLEYKDSKYTDLAAGLGMIGSNILLSKYSRDNEREADLTGMEYAARAGHNPLGMPGVMEKFMSLHKSKPSAVELLFSTHPMSTERYQNTTIACQKQHKDISGRSMHRERYMDNIASVRSIKKAIVEMQNGDKSMYAKKYMQAQQHYSAALAVAPEDYAGLLMMSKCLMAQGHNKTARKYVAQAKDVYPQEAQALHVAGMVGIKMRSFDSALADFVEYEKRLPGNPNTIFFRGLCNEKMGRKELAARDYKRYHYAAPRGDYSGYVQNNLIKWGYMAQPQQNQGSK